MPATCVRIEGGLLSPDFLERIHTQDGQKPRDFGVNRSLVDEIASVWADAQTYWKAFERRRAHASQESITTITREQWVIPLLEALGYQLTFQRRAMQVDGRTYAISHRAAPSPSDSLSRSTGEGELDAPPVHIVGYDLELGNRPPAGRGTLSPHGLVQDYLNRSEHLWGIVTNGCTLRLLRDSVYFTRPAYIEFDLKQMLEGGRLDEFILLYRLAHRTRLPQGIDDADQCWLERYHQAALEQGGRIREGLRVAVEKAIVALANGFLVHPHNEPLRARIRQGKLTARELYRQLLYLIYRMLFLMVAEERNLLLAHHSPSPTHFDAARFYHDNLSIARLRALADEPLTAPERFDDLYLGLRLLFYILSDETSAEQLALPTLNGELFYPLADLDEARLSNRVLLHAIAELSYFEPPDEKVRRRVNYAALDVEELGSVYESLLDLQPLLTDTGGRLEFTFATGTERKSTGSYYTPPQLVNELIQSALVPVMHERLDAAKTAAEKKQAILAIRVCDPACGSGHFLLAAARTLGKELAKIETQTDEPSPEAIRLAVREVITHCIYGVDKNPLAVDLCKVALWLEGHAEGKPLTFLDHRIRCGDSLVGVRDLSVLQEGIPDEAFEPVAGDNRRVAQSLKQQNRAERAGQFALPFDAPVEIDRAAASIRSLLEIPDDTPAQIRKKTLVLRDWERQTERDRTACHIWTAAFFQPLVSHSSPPIATDTLREYLQSGTAYGQTLGTALACANQYRFFHWPQEFPEVFVNGGFDLVIGNPPFMGGLKISGNLGEKYRHWLEVTYAPYGGTADLCAAFYRRAYSLLKPGARMGMVATNTISQGDTRESGLAVILREGGTITFAKRFIKWLGAANVEVNLVAIEKRAASSERRAVLAILDGQTVPFISSRLDAEPEAEPKRLPKNEGKAFIGDTVVGIGFVLEPEEAEVLVAKDPRNADCLFPYLNGEDLNSRPEQKPSRWVICFHDWDLERAKRYPDLLRIVEERVKPQRSSLPPHNATNRKRSEYWWQFGVYAQNMRRAIAPLRWVLVRAEVSQLHMVSFVPKEWIYSHMLIVFAFDDDYHFALLQSGVHEAWLRQQASSLRTDIRYTPTDCFDTFPFPPLEYERLASGKWQLEVMPQAFQQAAQVGAAYHEHRRQVMLARQLGLTKTYNLFHNPACQDADIVRLRKLHAEMDRAILACYGWEDLEPSHNFYQNDRGQTRYTISPEARRQVLARLVGLNLEIASQER